MDFKISKDKLHFMVTLLLLILPLDPSSPFVQTFLRIRPEKSKQDSSELNPFLDPRSPLPPHLEIISEQDIQLSMSPSDKVNFFLAWRK